MKSRKGMNVLVVGYGSIGRRHVFNLARNGRIGTIFLNTKVKNPLSALSDPKNKVRIVKGKDLGDLPVDFAIICNETRRHIKSALPLAKKGISLFIEKPVSCDLAGVGRLKESIGKKKIKLFVAYNLRFLGAVKYIKEQIANKTIGDLYFARIEAGQYLPAWRKNISYEKSYSASKRRGGGVELDISHEIDYMRYFFGDPLSRKIMKAKVSKLNIDSNDVFEGLYLYKNNFICNVHLDYLEPSKRRQIRIVGSKGVLLCDFVKKEIRVSREGRKELVLRGKKYFDIDKTYIDEVNHFIASMQNGSRPCITLDDGLKALELTKD